MYLRIPPRPLRSKDLIAASAGWRNDAVHAQVFHHLAVVIKSMGHGKRSAEQLGCLSLAKRAGNLGRRIFRRERLRRFMPNRERVFQIFHDLSFALARKGRCLPWIRIGDLSPVIAPHSR